jgi:DNA-binding Lrp family transcriptional regulator
MRLLNLLNTGIPDTERSLDRLSKLLGVSKGCLEYHIRRLRASGDVTRDDRGVLRALTASTQLTLGLDFDVSNVVELSAARRSRELSCEADSFCDLLVRLSVPSKLSASDIVNTLESAVEARGVRVFVETPTKIDRTLASEVEGG